MKKTAVKSLSPIVLIGTHRSGTTWLGDAISRAPRMAYWVEPRHVWSYGNWFLPDDRLDAGHATRGIRRRITRRFAAFTAARDADRFCEKTPSNCLRVPFIHAVFPDVRFVFLVRDGRAVFRSTDEIRKTGIGWYRIGQRLAETTIGDLPAFLDRIPWIWHKLRRKPLRFWGVRPPGWQEWLENDSQNVILAKQWAGSIKGALDGLVTVPDHQKLTVRYEDLVKGGAVVEQLLDFATLRDNQTVRDYLLQTARPERADRWRGELPEELLEEIRPHIEPTLNQLDYHW